MTALKDSTVGELILELRQRASVYSKEPHDPESIENVVAFDAILLAGQCVLPWSFFGRIGFLTEAEAKHAEARTEDDDTTMTRKARP